jgi:hypothetical protein
MKGILEHLELADTSTKGQKAFADERALIKNKNKNNNEAISLITTGAGAEKKVYPKGSCNNHPDSTTHDTSMCSLSKDNNKDIKSTDADYVIPGIHKCAYCFKNHKRIHKTHPINRCVKDPKSDYFGKSISSTQKDKKSKNDSLNSKIDKLTALIASQTGVESSDQE